MIKTLALAFALLTFSFSSLAQVVQVIMDKTELHKNTDVSFAVRCASEQDLEIVVFCNEYMPIHQNATLTPGDHPFDFKTNDAPLGKYFILVTGNGIHVEKEFFLIN
jgi:hypothetical protein